MSQRTPVAAPDQVNADAMGRPSLAGDRRSFTDFPGQLALANEAAPRILNKVADAHG